MPSFQRALAMPGVVIESEVPLTLYIGQIMQTGQIRPKPVFTGYCISAADPTRAAELAAQVARARIAGMFWEQTLRNIVRVQAVDFLLEVAPIEQAAAAEVARHTKSGGLPEGFIMKFEKVPMKPEATSPRGEENFLALMRELDDPFPPPESPS